MESGATIWEIRTMAAEMDGRGTTNRIDIHSEYRNAILIEALECLAAKKEAERAAG